VEAGAASRYVNSNMMLLLAAPAKASEKLVKNCGKIYID
jgi:hypothetical protein